MNIIIRRILTLPTTKNISFQFPISETFKKIPYDEQWESHDFVKNASLLKHSKHNEKKTENLKLSSYTKTNGNV